MQKRYASDFFPEDCTPELGYPGVAVYLASEVEELLSMVDEQFGYPKRGPAVDASCMCSYCQYARVRSLMVTGEGK